MKASKVLLQRFSFETSKLNVMTSGNAKLRKKTNGIHQCNVPNEFNCALYCHKMTKNIFANIFEHRLEYRPF